MALKTDAQIHAGDFPDCFPQAGIVLGFIDG